MIEITNKPSENLPIEDDDEPEGSQTLMVPPPSLRERIHAAQRARTLKIQPNIEEPEKPPVNPVVDNQSSD